MICLFWFSHVNVTIRYQKTIPSIVVRWNSRDRNVSLFQSGSGLGDEFFGVLVCHIAVKELAALCWSFRDGLVTRVVSKSF